MDLPFLDMPAMQRMADEGAICRQHYSSPNLHPRAVHLGHRPVYPHTHGAFDNQHGWVPDESPIMMEHLKAAGYRNTSVGKMHFCPLDRMAGFDRRITPDQKEGRRNDDDYAKFLRAHGYSGNRIRLNSDEHGEGDLYHCYDFPAPEEMHIDHYVGTQATRLIEQGELRFATQRWQNEPVVLATPLAATESPVTIEARWMRA